MATCLFLCDVISRLEEQHWLVNGEQVGSGARRGRHLHLHAFCWLSLDPVHTHRHLAWGNTQINTDERMCDATGQFYALCSHTYTHIHTIGDRWSWTESEDWQRQPYLVLEGSVHIEADGVGDDFAVGPHVVQHDAGVGSHGRGHGGREQEWGHASRGHLAGGHDGPTGEYLSRTQIMRWAAVWY